MENRPQLTPGLRSIIGMDAPKLQGQPEFGIDELTKKVEEQYGPCDRKDYSEYTLINLPNESGFYHGEEIKWAMDIRPVPKRVLLAGEDKQIARIFKDVVLPKSKIIKTAGIKGDADYEWEFTSRPPLMGTFNLIISQAILEHLVNAYGHIRDLSNMLDKDGHLIIHTHFPGFQYHRYPIDGQRFYPDWFEEIANPNHANMRVVKRKLKEGYNLIYMLQKK